ncbi:hypothetical protein [Leptolyngbya sp. FACHB-261]|uniref:hypothetical protein n=1 Tax=Leptolyngbya sp. FACHB-261 TaxID=2692806 RepID=UPI001689CEB0|nr:hypothetical protein [Leptolyngbya sp. FACHB-261]MBD2102904.1 hypothetical protein [Leptolyngbya sp. FACHB-261]
MLSEILPFQISVSPSTVAGVGLWAMAMYLAFFSLSEKLAEQLSQWLTRAEQIGGGTNAEGIGSLIASLCSIVPFLGLGLLLNWGVEWSLGHSWAVSMGLLACMSLGVYELGRRDGEAS